MSKTADPFVALADPTRRSIIERLRAGAERTAGEIAEGFPRISRPAVSRHLRVLRESGLINARQDGREWWYTMDADAVARIYYEWFASLGVLREASLERLRGIVETDDGDAGNE